MTIYVSKITSPEVVEQVVSLQRFTHEGINNFYNDLQTGDIIFIYFGGDQNNINWTQGLRGIGTVSLAPYERGYDQQRPRNFKIEIEPKHVLSDSVPPKTSKIHARWAELLWEVPYVGANHFPNQAIARCQNSDAINALANLYSEQASADGGFMARSILESLGLLGQVEVHNLASDLYQDIKSAGVVLGDSAVRQFITATATRRFSLLAGLSGSGKTLLAQAIAVWFSSVSSDGFGGITKSVLENSEDLRHYKLVRISDVALEVINTNGPNQQVIPLSTGALREWLEAFRSGAVGIDEGAQDASNQIKERSKYQHYTHEFYNEYRAIAKAMIDCLPSTVANDGLVATIPIGANWTSKDDLLGYPDALRPGNFVKRPALELLIRAHENWKLTGGGEGVRPFFLILDEMNLSHVERYFSDFLSAMESGGEIELHDMSEPDKAPDEGGNIWDGVPARIRIPGNLFVIGTVNVDETTYMFSPKVLDRANVLEFRAEKDAVSAFMDGKNDVKLDAIAGKGAHFGEEFVRMANLDTQLGEPYVQWLKIELDLIFEFLADHDGEFGFRTVRAITRFVQFTVMLQGNPEEGSEQRKLFMEAMDAQVMQKILPRMHGSKKKLGPLLRGLGELCARETNEQEDGNGLDKARDTALNNSDETSLFKEPLVNLIRKCQANELPDDVRYPLSLGKIIRMLRMLERDGFASFAEA